MIETFKEAVPPASDRDREELVGRLFKEYWRPVVYFFRRRGLPSDVCSDLTQETFLRVYRGMEGFRHEAQVKTWVFRIAANVWLNTVRDSKAMKRAGRHVPLDEVADLGVAPTGDPRAPRSALQQLLDQERMGRVRSALEELPPQMRRCVLLYVDQELKYREIAVAMNISEGTVKSQIHEARERLRARLGEEMEIRDER